MNTKHLLALLLAVSAPVGAAYASGAPAPAAAPAFSELNASIYENQELFQFVQVRIGGEAKRVYTLQRLQESDATAAAANVVRHKETGVWMSKGALIQSKGFVVSEDQKTQGFEALVGHKAEMFLANVRVTKKTEGATLWFIGGTTVYEVDHGFFTKAGENTGGKGMADYGVSSDVLNALLISPGFNEDGGLPIMGTTLAPNFKMGDSLLKLVNALRKANNLAPLEYPTAEATTPASAGAGAPTTDAGAGAGTAPQAPAGDQPTAPMAPVILAAPAPADTDAAAGAGAGADTQADQTATTPAAKPAAKPAAADTDAAAAAGAGAGAAAGAAATADTPTAADAADVKPDTPDSGDGQ